VQYSRVSCTRSPATCDAQQQHGSARQAGHHAEHAVCDGGGEALRRPEPDDAEPDGGDSLARSPATDVERQGHDQEREHEQREQLGDRRRRADGTGGHHERSEIAGQCHDGQPDDSRSRARGQQRPDVGDGGAQAGAQEPAEGDCRHQDDRRGRRPPCSRYQISEHAEQDGLHRQHHQ
jgi:hypothetical protein